MIIRKVGKTAENSKEKHYCRSLWWVLYGGANQQAVLQMSEYMSDKLSEYMSECIQDRMPDKL